MCRWNVARLGVAVRSNVASKTFVSREPFLKLSEANGLWWRGWKIFIYYWKSISNPFFCIVSFLLQTSALLFWVSDLLRNHVRNVMGYSMGDWYLEWKKYFKVSSVFSDVELGKHSYIDTSVRDVQRLSKGIREHFLACCSCRSGNSGLLTQHVASGSSGR